MAAIRTVLLERQAGVAGYGHLVGQTERWTMSRLTADPGEHGDAGEQGALPRSGPLLPRWGYRRAHAEGAILPVERSRSILGGCLASRVLVSADELGRTLATLED